MINSQRGGGVVGSTRSISKGMGDQFSAADQVVYCDEQYIKGDG